jgi:hypothetical protein
MHVQIWRSIMSDPYKSHRSTPFRAAGAVNIPSWAVVVTAIIAGALGVGLFLLSASILLVLTPVVVAGVLYARWRIRRALRRSSEHEQANSIAAEYRVIDIDRDR